MRLCRFEAAGTAQVGFYIGEQVIPLAAAAQAAEGSLSEGDEQQT